MTSSIADESVSIEKLSIKEEEARIFPVKTSTYQIRGVRDGEQNLTVDLVVSKFSNLTQITLTSVGKPGTFYEVRKSNSASGIDSSSPAVVKTRLLFGRENTELLELTARAVAAIVPGDVIVSLGFSKLTEGLMGQVVALAREHLQ